MVNETSFDGKRLKWIGHYLKLEETLHGNENITLLKERYKDLFELEFALSFITNILPISMSLEEKLRIIDLNLKLKHQLMKQKPKYDLGNGFEIVYNTEYEPRHIESPLEFELRYHNERIGSYNYYLRPGNPTELRINNIQGTKDKDYELRLLSQHFGIDWRLGIARILKNFGESKHLVVIGELPGIFGLSKEEYKILLKNYIRTYHNAGINTIDPYNVIDFDENIDDFVENVKKNQEKAKKEKDKNERRKQNRLRRLI